MNIWQALILGVVQGLTEFLPISSSGHLVIVQSLLNLTSENISFEIAVHLGTLLAVLVYFRNDLKTVIVDFFKGGEGRWIGWMIILGTIPTAIIGLAFKDPLEALFASSKSAAIGLLFTTGFLVVAELVRRGERPLTKIRWKDAILIGILQGCAIVPGISRSGSTIAAGLFAGLNRDSAARYSFLLAIPAILGATVLHLKDFQTMESGLFAPYLVGFLASVFSGYLAIGILMRVLRTGKLYGFAAYTLVVGILVLILG
ncbi:undecaprenyl-diphosphatase UppP [bacterium]|nr:undecaprenyl-diphosphatase UppP [bacterium]